MKARFLLTIYILFFALFYFTGCGIYSFTGASIPPEAKTISVLYFPNKSQLIQPTLSQKLTDAVKDKFASQTSLQLIKSGGDLHIEGEIVGYDTKPIAIQANETAAMNRLTISIYVRFTNRFDEKQNFETKFSRFQDYESNLSLSSVEEGLIDQINEALVEDIFNKAVVNW
ncbi:LptE family protein [Bacteroidota bacterium]